MPKVSIIIPVYNASKYIEQCIASLLCQTIDSYEILIIDDRGTDDSIEKVQAISTTHAMGDKIIIHQMPSNSGAWAARNYGLGQAQGEYIAFVDADDWCDSNMFNALYGNAKQHNADWSYGGALKELSLGLNVPLMQTPLPSGELTVESRKKFAINSESLFWTGIYKRQFLIDNNIRFPQSKFSEDSYFLMMVAFLSDRVAVDLNHYYHYRIQESSVSRIPDCTKAIQKVNIFAQLKNDLTLKGVYANYSQEIDYLCIKKGYIIPLIIECVNHSNDCVERVAAIKKHLLENIPDYKANQYLKSNLRNRLLLTSLIDYPKLMSFLLRIKYKQDPF